MLASQKLESIGTLASGIAHDFNNLLGGVLALAELALAEVAAGSDPVDELNGICSLAIRGAEIVRELMVYAGEETAVVTLVDLSQTVSEMVALLKVSSLSTPYLKPTSITICGQFAEALHNCNRLL